MSSHEDTDETSGIDRRSLMRAAGAAGATTALGAAGASTAGASEPDAPTTSTTDLEGSRRLRALDAVARDDAAERIAAELRERGAEPQLRESTVFRVDHETEPATYTVAVVPFETDDPATQSYMLWSDTDRAMDVGVVAESVDDGYEITNVEDVGGAVSVSRRTVTDAQLRSFGRRVETVGATSMGGFPNCDIDFDCVAIAAAKAGVLYGACASCAGGFVPACFACVGSGILLVETDCTLCD